MFITDKSQLEKFSTPYRLWQGIPGIEVTKKGRIFSTFYSGGTKEEVNNMYSMLVNNTAFPSETIKPCYVPSIYNIIEDKSKQPVIYSNKFAVSDFNNKANVVITEFLREHVV